MQGFIPKTLSENRVVVTVIHVYFSLVVNIIVLCKGRDDRMGEVMDSKTKKLSLKILVLAVLATLVSLLYKQPPKCGYGLCGPGEQRAGYPLPFVFDFGSTGSSPLEDSVRLDSFDYLVPHLLPCTLNIVFYSGLFLLVRLMVLYVRRRQNRFST